MLATNDIIGVSNMIRGGDAEQVEFCRKHLQLLPLNSIRTYFDCTTPGVIKPIVDAGSGKTIEISLHGLTELPPTLKLNLQNVRQVDIGFDYVRGTGSPVKSLSGVHDFLIQPSTHCPTIHLGMALSLNVLGLILLDWVYLNGQELAVGHLAYEIIEHYRRHVKMTIPRIDLTSAPLIDCQHELIEAGLGEYAGL